MEVVFCRRPLTTEFARTRAEYVTPGGSFQFFRMPSGTVLQGLNVRLINTQNIPGALHPRFVETIGEIDPVQAKAIAESQLPSLDRSKGSIKWRKGRVRGIEPNSYAATLGFNNGDMFERATASLIPSWGHAAGVSSVEIYEKGVMVISCSQPDSVEN